MEQHAHQRHMHMRHQQFEKIGMTFGQHAGNLCKDEKALRPAAGIKNSMDCYAVQVPLLEIARELPVCRTVRVLRTEKDGLILADAPCRQDAKNDAGIRPAKLGELRFVYMLPTELFYADPQSQNSIPQSTPQPQAQPGESAQPQPESSPFSPSAGESPQPPVLAGP